MSKQPQVKTTFGIDEDLLDEFSSIVSGLYLRRDALLNLWLATEIELLSAQKPNSAAASMLLNAVQESARAAQKKVVVKLDRVLVERINEVCREKRVPRDAFFEGFVRFLIRGDASSNWIPLLHQAREILESPRHTIFNSEEYQPYDELSLGDMSKEELVGLLRSREV